MSIMKSRFLLGCLLAFCSLSVLADTEETITVAGTTVNNFATRITFNGSNVTLTYADGTTQTASADGVSIDFDYVATLSDASNFDNLTTLKTFGKKVVNVKVIRTVKSGQWNTLCLPFDMDAATVAEVFGNSTVVAELDYASDNTVNFKKVSAIVSGVPYIIQPADEVTEIAVENVMLNNLVSGNIALSTDFNFVGTILEEVPDGLVYYFANGNKLRKLAAGNAIKAFHAYLLGNDDSNEVNSFSVDGNLLGIVTIVSENIEHASGVYNLNGQYMGRTTMGLQKGVYVVNGKKMVVR